MGSVSWKPLRKCSKRSHQVKKDDHFSRLPDEIIVSHILPRLTLQEALRTSVLSRRWRNLWTHSIGPKLNISFAKTRFPNRELKEYDAARMRPLFVLGVSHVLETYSKPMLDELTIRFDLDSSSSDHIGSWVAFALKKGVNRLELDLSDWGFNNFSRKLCAFPSVEKISAWLGLSDNHLCQPVQCAGIHSLRDLCLRHVSVSSEVIELMLSNCPLERLCLSESSLSERLKVSRQLVKLKSLEFASCYCTKFEISAPNLVSLHFSGGSKDLRLHEAPLLSEFSIGEKYCEKFLRRGGLNFGFLSQLKKLRLEITPKAVNKSTSFPLEFPEFMKLEQLELKMMSVGDSCVLWPIVLIKAAPFLHRCSVQLHILANEYNYKEKKKPRKERNLLNAIKLVQHRCLKVVEFRYFSSSLLGLELAHCLISISPSLEKFVVPSQRWWTLGEPAEKLANLLPEGAKLVLKSKYTNKPLDSIVYEQESRDSRTPSDNQQPKSCNMSIFQSENYLI